MDSEQNKDLGIKEFGELPAEQQSKNQHRSGVISAVRDFMGHRSSRARRIPKRVRNRK